MQSNNHHSAGSLTRFGWTNVTPRCPNFALIMFQKFPPYCIYGTLKQKDELDNKYLPKQRQDFKQLIDC